MRAARAAVRCLVILVVVSGAANADPSSARERFDAGVALYQQLDYAGASQEFAAAYALEPRPDYLYAWAQSERLAGNCRVAVPLYRKFLATNPSAQQAELARGGIELCPPEAPPEQSDEPPPGSSELERPAPAGDAAGGANAGDSGREASPSVSTRARPHASPWYRDRLGNALTLVGLVGVTAGVVLYLGARSDVRAARTAVDYDEYDRLASDARRRETIAWVSGTAGVALVTAAILRFALRSPGEQPTSGVSASVTPTRVGIWFGGSF